MLHFREENLFNDLDELIKVRKIIIDTSSLIYFEKLDLIEFVTKNLKLYTIPEVFNEWGHLIGDFPQISSLEITNVDPEYEKLNTDKKLVYQAIRLHRPVIAEDRRILRNVMENNIPAWSILPIIVGLIARHALLRSEYDRCRTQLIDFAKYSRDVLDWTDALIQCVDKTGT